MSLRHTLFICGILVVQAHHVMAQSATAVQAADLFGCTPTHYISAASNNSTSITQKRSTVYDVTAINTSSTLYFLKLYDKVSAPTCGTDTPVATYPVPHNTGAGGGLVHSFVPGIKFDTGIGMCLVSGIADNNNGSAAANAVAINVCSR